MFQLPQNTMLLNPLKVSMMMSPLPVTGRCFGIARLECTLTLLLYERQGIATPPPQSRLDAFLEPGKQFHQMTLMTDRNGNASRCITFPEGTSVGGRGMRSMALYIAEFKAVSKVC